MELKTSLLGIVGKYNSLNKYFRGMERLQPFKFVEGREKMMKAVETFSQPISSSDLLLQDHSAYLDKYDVKSMKRLWSYVVGDEGG